jgi:hypothetical protein
MMTGRESQYVNAATNEMSPNKSLERTRER